MMSFIDAFSIFCNAGILLTNIITCLIFLFGVIRVRRFWAFWLLLAVYPFYILLSALNLLLSFGKDTVLAVLPVEVFRVIYPVSLLAAPISGLLSIVGAFLIVRYVIKKETTS